MHSDVSRSPFVSIEDDTESRKKDSTSGEDSGENELKDAVIKLIRLLANLCIDEQIGSHVGGRHENLQVMMFFNICMGWPYHLEIYRFYWSCCSSAMTRSSRRRCC